MLRRAEDVVGEERDTPDDGLAGVGEVQGLFGFDPA